MAFNITAIVAVHDTVQLLYPDVDLSRLTWLEQRWTTWYIWIGNPVFATCLMSFLLHEVGHFACFIPWIIMDAIPYFRKWRIQPHEVQSTREQWELCKHVYFCHYAGTLPTILLFHFMAVTLGMKTYQVPFPSWKIVLLENVAFFVITDLIDYFAHRAFHWGPLYTHIHKIHHRYSARAGLAALYAHPAEVFLLNCAAFVGPILYCYTTRNLHMFTIVVFCALRLLQAIDMHSGYDFPWSLHHIPIFSGAEHHHFHHMALTNNFSSTFRWWDRLFGTDDKYREYRKRTLELEVAMEGKSRAELEAAEDRLIEEVEEQGYHDQAIAEGYLVRKLKIQ